MPKATPQKHFSKQHPNDKENPEAIAAPLLWRKISIILKIFGLKIDANSVNLHDMYHFFKKENYQVGWATWEAPIPIWGRDVQIRGSLQACCLPKAHSSMVIWGISGSLNIIVLPPSNPLASLKIPTSTTTCRHLYKLSSSCSVRNKSLETASPVQREKGSIGASIVNR